MFVAAFVLLGLAKAPAVDNPAHEDSLNPMMVVIMALSSRVLTGLAIGIICCSVSNYQTEMCVNNLNCTVPGLISVRCSCTKDIRGKIGTVFQIAIVMGLVSAYLLGLLLDSWRCDICRANSASLCLTRCRANCPQGSNSDVHSKSGCYVGYW